MKVIVILVVMYAFGTILNRLVKKQEAVEIAGQVETIHFEALLISPRILRCVLEFSGDLLLLKLHWKPSANAGVNDSQGLGSWLMGRDYPNDSIAKNTQNP